MDMKMLRQQKMLCICFLVFVIIHSVVTYDPRYIRHGGITIRIQQQQQKQHKKDNLPGWGELYKKLETRKHLSGYPSKKRDYTYNRPNARLAPPVATRVVNNDNRYQRNRLLANRNLAPKPNTNPRNLQRSPAAPRPRLAPARLPIMNYFYNQQRMQQQYPSYTARSVSPVPTIPSLNKLFSGYYPAVTQMERQRISKMYPNLQLSQQKRTQRKSQKHYELDKKDIIRQNPIYNTAYYNPYRTAYPNWGLYSRQPSTRSFIPTMSQYYSSIQAVPFQQPQMNSLTRGFIQGVKKNIIAPIGRLPANVNTTLSKNMTNLTEINGKSNFSSSPANVTTQSISAPVLGSKKINSTQGTLNNKSASIDSSWQQNNVSKGVIANNVTVNKDPTIDNSTKQNIHALLHSFTWKKHHLFHKTKNSTNNTGSNWTLEKRHHFHKQPVKTEAANKRGVLPDENDFQDENGDFPGPEREEEENQGGSFPVNGDDLENFDNISDEEQSLPQQQQTQPQLQQQQQQTPSLSERNMQEVPLVNFETPDMNGIPEYVRKEMTHLPEQKFTDLDFLKKEVEAVPGEKPGAEFTAPPDLQSTIHQKAAAETNSAIADIDASKQEAAGAGDTEEKLKEKIAKGTVSDEESEAMKEDKDASNLIKSTDDKMEDRPDVLNMGNNGISRPMDKSLMNMGAGNVATPDNEIGMDPSEVRNNLADPTSNMNKMHGGANLVDPTSSLDGLQQANNLIDMTTNTNKKHGGSNLADPTSSLDGLQQANNLIDMTTNTNKKHGGANLADPTSSLDGLQQANNLMDPTSKVDRMHEELRDEENEPRLSKFDSPAHQGETKSTPESTEDTIQKLQENDFMDSEKIVNNLSKLKEPPNSLALGGFDARMLMKNEEDHVNGGVALNDEKQGRMREGGERDGPSDEEKASMLDPEKAQEMALALQARVKHEKEMKKKQEHESPTGRSSNGKEMTPQDAMNALAGKPLPKINLFNSSADHSLDKQSNEHDARVEIGKQTVKQKNDSLISAIDSIKKKENPSNEINNIQSPKEVPSNDTPTSDKETANHQPNVKSEPATAPTTSSSPTPDKKDDAVKEPALTSSATTVAANAVVSSQVVDLLKSMGQIKSHASKEGEKKKFTNATITGEEKETQEAVKDLNVAIGILEKKLTLINKAKTSGEKKNIFIVDNEHEKNENAAAKSQIELNNSLKLLEKVMNVATRVKTKKQKKTKIDDNSQPKNQILRNEIGRVDTTDDYSDVSNYESLPTPPVNEENSELLHDENKRNQIYRYPDLFIRSPPTASRMTQRRRVPSYNNRSWRRSRIPFYTNPYNYQERSYLWDYGSPSPWYPEY